MLLKYVSKFVMDILPSVVATILGAYIVNHYINTKPAAPVAAAVSTAEPAADPKKTETKAAKTDAKGPDKGSETPSDVATVPEPAPAKKSTADKTPVPVEKIQEKSADKPTETASLPVETRRHPPAIHDRTVARSVSAPAPAVAGVSAVPLVETSPAQEERRDANDLARAAIERLRGTGEASRAPDVPRVQEPRVQESPRAVPPLPPAITVSTPPGDAYNPNVAPKPPYAPVARADDPLRPMPPADIPTASRPMDLHAEATASLPEHKTVGTVAEDMLSAAKSVFHAVLPH
jgi:hypothetical protein